MSFGGESRWRVGASLLMLEAALLLLSVPSPGQTQKERAEIEAHRKTEKSLQEVARQIHNPISTLWQLTFDSQIIGLGGGGLDAVEPAYTGTFEPVMPINLSKLGLEGVEWAENFNVIRQLTLPFIETLPQPRGSGSGERTSGFGDIQLGSVLAPDKPFGFLWGLGPTFIFPSASDDTLGQGKWQVGPAAVAGYQGTRWTVYALVQQWWSFAGDAGRPRTNQLNLSYVLLRSLPHRWQIGTQPTMTVDWTASRGNAVSLPVGLGFGRTIRVGKIPVQLWLEADYYPVRPDDLSGARWGIDIQIIPVIRELY